MDRGLEIYSGLRGQLRPARWIACRKLPNRRRIVFSLGLIRASRHDLAVGGWPWAAMNDLTASRARSTGNPGSFEISSSRWAPQFERFEKCMSGSTTRCCGLLWETLLVGVVQFDDRFRSSFVIRKGRRSASVGQNMLHHSSGGSDEPVRGGSRMPRNATSAPIAAIATPVPMAAR